MERTVALQGTRILEIGIAGVVPFAARCLASYGAEVVKIESSKRVDIMRVTPPYADGKAGIDRSAPFAYAGAGKYSITLDLNKPRAIDVAKRLVAWSGIVLDGYTPGTLEKRGLGYNDLIKVRSDIIMVSTASQGQTGPLRDLPAFGFNLKGLAGFVGLTGWADRPGVGPQGPYTDMIAPMFVTVAVMAALDYRRRTGKGQYIDCSQLEASLSFLGPALLDYTTNGRIESRRGNECPYAAPHGAYRCRGDDRWCVIAVFTDAEWQAFSKVIGNPSWVKDPRFTTLSGRKTNEAELDRLVDEWTVSHSAEEVMDMMQQAGVAAGVVQNARDLCENDPHLKHRHFFHLIRHPVMGQYSMPDSPYRLSKTSAELRRAPCFGEHNEYICTELLGMSDEEFLELSNTDVLA